MRAICKNIVVITVISLLSFISLTASAQSNSWIVGTWQLSHDPDGNSQDKLVFKKNNKFTNIDGRGKKFNGNYSVKADIVEVELTRKGEPFMAFFLGFHETQDSLYYYSEKTKQTSIYKKLK